MQSKKKKMFQNIQLNCILHKLKNQKKSIPYFAEDRRNRTKLKRANIH